MLSRFKISKLPLPGLKLIERTVIDDERGFLSRLFSADELALIGWDDAIAQVNHTFTRRRGTIRGMHYQEPPYSEIKLVSCIRGEIWDVAIDLRATSPTFLKVYGTLLSEKNCCAMLIPRGFAHGFQAMVNNCEVIYLHSGLYQPSADKGLRYDDPVLQIDWPCPVSLISKRDQSHQLLTSKFRGIQCI